MAFKTRFGIGGVILAAALSGCESGPKAGGLNQAVTAYNQQRFTEARDLAAKESTVSTGDARCAAAYVAGLSSYQLGNKSEAEQQFEIARGSSDPETAAKAAAMLGQVRLDQGRPREAASLLTAATTNLPPDDAKRACYNAGVAYRNAGDEAKAKEWFARSRGESPTMSAAANPPAAASASKPVTAPGNGASAAPAAKAGGFAIQVGAFADRSRAEQAASEATPLARNSGLGDATIVQRKDDRGKRVYVVQIGAFPTRDAAAAARAKLGKLQYIVVAAAS